ncbi:BQ2448_4756 [Microbotryum intermedium]|uniref:BQ2448_4756 protein n=1 Tax=Microbotryum intermedium TaxID=269621 RepID=A0A238FE14_9BASI|nr:BQ2448_4756 [Microbotryum intermedium]
MSIRRPPTSITLKPSDVAEMQAFVQARQAAQANSNDHATSDPNAPSSTTTTTMADHNGAKRKKKTSAQGAGVDQPSEAIRSRNERIGV